jgi:hypothetical protein
LEQPQINVQSAQEIYDVYSSHKRMDIQSIELLTESTLVHLVAGGVGGKLILFAYNDMVKYICGYSAE